MIYKSKSKLEALAFSPTARSAPDELGEYTGEKIAISEARRRARTQKHIAICDLNSRWAIDGKIGAARSGGQPHVSPNVYIRIAYGRMSSTHNERSKLAKNWSVIRRIATQRKIEVPVWIKRCKDFI